MIGEDRMRRRRCADGALLVSASLNTAHHVGILPAEGGGLVKFGRVGRGEGGGILHLTLEVPLPPCVRTTVPPCCRIIIARTSAASWSTLALSPPPAPPPPPPPETIPAGMNEKRRARASSSGAAASLSHIVFPATAPVPRSITRPARLDILSSTATIF